MKRVATVVVVWVASFLFGACGGGGSGGGGACSTTADCPHGTVCVDGRCRTAGDAAGDALPDTPGEGTTDAELDGVDGIGPSDGPPGDGPGADAEAPDGPEDLPSSDRADGTGDGDDADGPPPDGVDSPGGDADDDAPSADGDAASDTDGEDAAAEDAAPDGFWVDDDGDTFAEGTGDCDDADPRIHPGATGHIEGVDYDCDGKVEYLATLLITVDDWYERLCVSDVDVVVDPAASRDWYRAESYTAVMETGINVVGVHGVDLYEVISAFMMRIEVAGLTFLTSGVSPGEPDTTPWRYSPDPDAGPQADWCSPWYDDSAWGPARYVAEWGSSPWGGSPPELAGTGADWIWDDRPAALLDAWFRIEIALP